MQPNPPELPHPGGDGPSIPGAPHGGPGPGGTDDGGPLGPGQGYGYDTQGPGHDGTER